MLSRVRDYLLAKGKSMSQHMRLNVSKLKNSDFTIISNNCVAGIIYNSLNHPFCSPTINLYFFYPDYIYFLENFWSIIKLDLVELKKSKYEGEVSYPIGSLGKGIEIHFLHYETFELANSSWEKRKMRINENNVFVIGSDLDGCKPNHIEEFENLHFKNKVFFSAKHFNHLNSVIQIKKYSKMDCVGDMIKDQEWLNYFDLIHWLNTGEIRRYGIRRHILELFYR